MNAFAEALPVIWVALAIFVTDAIYTQRRGRRS